MLIAVLVRRELLHKLAKMPKQAAKLFESERDWTKAAEQYKLAGMPRDAAQCRAKYFENKEQWLDAAEQYELAEMPEQADSCRDRLSLSDE